MIVGHIAMASVSSSGDASQRTDQAAMRTSDQRSEDWTVTIDRRPEMITKGVDSSPDSLNIRITNQKSGYVLAGRLQDNHNRDDPYEFTLVRLENDLGEPHQTDSLVEDGLHQLHIQLHRDIFVRALDNDQNGDRETPIKASFSGTPSFDKIRHYIQLANSKPGIELPPITIAPKILQKESPPIIRLDLVPHAFNDSAKDTGAAHPNWPQITEIFQNKVLNELRTTLASANYSTLSNPKQFDAFEKSVSTALEGMQRAFELGMRVHHIPLLVLQDTKIERDDLFSNNNDAIPFNSHIELAKDFVRAPRILGLKKGLQANATERRRIRLAEFDLRNQIIERATALFLLAKPALGGIEHPKLSAETYLLAQEAIAHGNHGSQKNGTDSYDLAAEVTHSRTTVDLGALLQMHAAKIQRRLFNSNDADHTMPGGWIPDLHGKQIKVMFSADNELGRYVEDVSAIGKYTGPHIIHMIRILLDNAQRKLTSLQQEVIATTTNKKHRTLDALWPQTNTPLLKQHVKLKLEPDLSNWRDGINWNSKVADHVNNIPQALHYVQHNGNHLSAIHPWKTSTLRQRWITTRMHH